MTTLEVYNAIQDSLAKPRPFSLVRWGDGEGIIIDGDNAVERMHKHLISHLGYAPPMKQIRWIRHSLVEALTGCTILGSEATAGQLKRQGYWSQMAEIIHKYAPDCHPEHTCSADVHVHMLFDGLFDKLLQGREELYYISGRDLDAQLKQRYGIKKITSFHIRPQARYELVQRGTPHFPDQYLQMHAWIRSLGDLTGKLCLVGAGYVGKVYLEWFRQQGGIAVDTGCVFDLWYGKRTRGKGKGPTATIDTYKLVK